MKRTSQNRRLGLIVLFFGLLMMSRTGYAQDTAIAIPHELMLKIIQDVERGEACKIEVQLLKERIAVQIVINTILNDIIERQREQLTEEQAINAFRAEQVEGLQNEVRKAKTQRNIMIAIAALFIGLSLW